MQKVQELSFAVFYLEVSFSFPLRYFLYSVR